MRVAQVMAGAAEGGAELFFERLCIALRAAGDEVLPVIRRNGARAATLREHDLAPVELGFGTAVDVLTRPRLRQALVGFRPDVAVFWMNRANQHAPRGDWASVGRLGGYYDLRYYTRRDHLIGNTHGIVDWLRRRGWAAARTSYLPNFADDFSACASASRDELGIAPGAKLLLGLGRLHDDKGFDTLIRALPAVPHTVLAIAGSGPEYAALQALAGRLGVAGRVRFLGWRRDAGALLRAADVFVCSSRVEPLGNMVLEAWGAERPVVATAADGPRELIASGIDGTLVPVDDAEALGAALAALLAAPAEAASLAAAGRRRFLAEFSRDVVVARWRERLAAISAERTWGADR